MTTSLTDEVDGRFDAAYIMSAICWVMMICDRLFPIPTIIYSATICWLRLSTRAAFQDVLPQVSCCHAWELTDWVLFRRRSRGIWVRLDLQYCTRFTHKFPLFRALIFQFGITASKTRFILLYVGMLPTAAYHATKFPFWLQPSLMLIFNAYVMLPLERLSLILDSCLYWFRLIWSENFAFRGDWAFQARRERFYHSWLTVLEARNLRQHIHTIL